MLFGTEVPVDTTRFSVLRYLVTADLLVILSNRPLVDGIEFAGNNDLSESLLFKFLIYLLESCPFLLLPPRIPFLDVYGLWPLTFDLPSSNVVI